MGVRCRTIVDSLEDHSISGGKIISRTVYDSALQNALPLVYGTQAVAYIVLSDGAEVGIKDPKVNRK
jgi:hypothetical protein